jgi:hypothetical protein
MRQNHINNTALFEYVPNLNIRFTNLQRTHA